MDSHVHRRLPINYKTLSDFCARHGIRRLSLFGSVTREDFGPESDIDVLVEFEPGRAPGLRFFDIQDELAVLLGRRVDLSTPGFLSKDVRQHIGADVDTLYAAA